MRGYRGYTEDLSEIFLARDKIRRVSETICVSSRYIRDRQNCRDFCSRIVQAILKVDPLLIQVYL